MAKISDFSEVLTRFPRYERDLREILQKRKYAEAEVIIDDLYRDILQLAVWVKSRNPT